MRLSWRSESSGARNLRWEISAAIAGTVLLLLTIFFYIPVLVAQFQTSPLAVEGINYAGDTLLFAATALLAGFGASQLRSEKLSEVEIEMS